MLARDYASDGIDDFPRWSVLVLLLGAACFRLLMISSAEVWFDEAMTWHYASKPWSEIAGFVGSNDVHPPLHFWFTKIFLIFGDGPFALRIGPALLEFLALPVVYFAAYQLAPEGQKRRVALFAMVLAALSANMMLTGSLARSYAGMYLAFTLCFAALCWIATHRNAVTKSVFSADGARARPAFAVLAFGLALLPWLHNLGLLYAMAVGLIAVIVWAIPLQRNAACFANFLAAAGLAALLYLPHLPTLLTQLEPVNSNYWIQAPTARGLARRVVEIFGELRAINAMGLGLAVFVCLVGLWSIYSLAIRRNWMPLFLTVGPLAVVFCLFLAVTYGVKPVMLNRSMVPMLAPWFVLLALGVFFVPGVIPRRVVGLVLCGAFVFSLLQNGDEPNWRGTTIQLIADDAETTPTIVTVPNAAAILMDYHAQQLDVKIKTLPLPFSYPDHSDGALFATGWPGVSAVNEAGLVALDDALAANDTVVWVYLRAYWIYDPRALLKPYLDRGYCYEPIDIPTRLYMVFKLVPRSNVAHGTCDTMGQDAHFPYIRPTYGLHSLRLTP